MSSVASSWAILVFLLTSYLQFQQVRSEMLSCQGSPLKHCFSTNGQCFSLGDKITKYFLNISEVFLIEHTTYKDNAVEHKHHGFEESKTSHFRCRLFRLWRKKGEEALLKVFQTIRLRALLSAFVIYHKTFTICI